MTREAARADLIERWDRDRKEAPTASRIILTHTNDEVQSLNAAARNCLRRSGELGEDVTLSVEKGKRTFAAGDRIMFGRNERSLGVKNGSLGIVQNVSAARIAVLLDDGRNVAFDVKDYATIDHGYAATIHKAQGVTVDSGPCPRDAGARSARSVCRAVASPRQRVAPLRQGRLR